MGRSKVSAHTYFWKMMTVTGLCSMKVLAMSDESRDTLLLQRSSVSCNCKEEASAVIEGEPAPESSPTPFHVEMGGKREEELAGNKNHCILSYADMGYFLHNLLNRIKS